MLTVSPACAGFGVMLVITGVGKTCTLAIAVFEGSATLVTVMLTEVGSVRSLGGVYTPPAEIVP